MAPFLAPINRQEGSQNYMFAIEERERPGVLIGDVGVHDMHTDVNERQEER
jgi:RimJ/RimL family protein N-acetyltransferase